MDEVSLGRDEDFELAPPARSNTPLLAVLVFIALGMLGFAFANAPLFGMLCGAIGIELNPNSDSAALGTDVSDRTIQVLNTASVYDSLPIKFKPLKATQTVRVGEEVLVDYYFKNLSDETIYFRALHDVLPARASEHFGMLACFCLDHQKLAPGQEVTLPLRFRIGTDLPEDVRNVTVGYQLFQLTESEYNPQGNVVRTTYISDLPESKP